MSIKEIHAQLVNAKVPVKFAYNEQDGKIKFSDDNFDRTLVISKRSNEIELFVFLSSKRKKFGAKQTQEQNKECAIEKNRFIKEVFNKLPIEFKLKEFAPERKYEVYDPANNTKGEDSKLDMPEFK
ncbi:hypothetical protein [Burkholderia cenocepacia]|uniref:hypothetical protein n=1 Tax=Burkholderia cenocepacia TaxID=95486 RepID=UPI00264F7682|nr:hypothetical protein [Burkholderia cenocepacia]MDN7680518.1 hypothetical protein [Burkholderia cenocepacia]